VKYCTKCLMPNTKPFLSFNDKGVCSACINHEKKQIDKDGINWIDREKEFRELINNIKSHKNKLYKVVIPVSGGKDSITQVHIAFKYGLRPLAVNVDYGIKTEIGRKNLNIVPSMGATLITVRPPQKIHKKLIKIGFEDYGDPDLMSHPLLYAFPHIVAIAFKTPLILWGEQSGFEYCDDSFSYNSCQIDRVWFLKHVVGKNITINDISKKYNISLDNLLIYDFPEDELKKSGIISTFLGCYFKWDSEENLKTAKSYGFNTLPHAREGTFRNYVGIDEKINRIHQYMKVLKFGYGRATDHACEEIRNGRMTREEAIEKVKKHDIQALSDYYVDDFCNYLGYSKEEFWSIMKKHCNNKICNIKDDKSLEVFGHKHF